jgi:hypothetical protein
MKRHLISLLLVIMFGYFGQAQQFAIQPGTLSYTVEPGKVQTQTVKVSNASDKKLSFQAYVGDWLRDSTGGHAYYRPDTLSRSCASWISLSRNFIEVLPGQTEEILVTLTGPNKEELYKQMKWAMLFVQTVQEQEAPKSGKEVKAQIRETVRVGVHIYQTPAGLINGSAQALNLRPAKEKNTYEFSVANTGDVQLQCKATLTLTNTATGEETKLERVEFPMFPEGKRVIKFSIPEKTAKGKYSALAVLDIGEDKELQAIEKTIEIK